MTLPIFFQCHLPVSSSYLFFLSLLPISLSLLVTSVPHIFTPLLSILIRWVQTVLRLSCPLSSLLIPSHSSHLFSSLSSHLFSSLSSHLFSSLLSSLVFSLVYSPLFSSLLISSPLISSLLISSPLISSLLTCLTLSSLSLYLFCIDGCKLCSCHPPH